MTTALQSTSLKDTYTCPFGHGIGMEFHQIRFSFLFCNSAKVCRAHLALTGFSMHFIFKTENSKTGHSQYYFLFYFIFYNQKIAPPTGCAVFFFIYYFIFHCFIFYTFKCWMWLHTLFLWTSCLLILI